MKKRTKISAVLITGVLLMACEKEEFTSTKTESWPAAAQEETTSLKSSSDNPSDDDMFDYYLDLLEPGQYLSVQLVEGEYQYQIIDGEPLPDDGDPVPDLKFPNTVAGRKAAKEYAYSLPCGYNVLISPDEKFIEVTAKPC